MKIDYPKICIYYGLPLDEIYSVVPGYVFCKFGLSVVSMFKTLMITWGSNNYFVKSPLLLVWLLSEFGINVQKQYNFTIFSNKNEKVEILEIWLILIITSLHLLYVWSEFGINVQKQYNSTIFTLMIYQWGSDNHLVSPDFQQTPFATLAKISLHPDLVLVI